MNAPTYVELEATSVRFYSRHDEDAFFEWLKKLPCVEKCQGRGLTVHISVKPALVDEDALREFLALFRRYGVDGRQLARFDREEFTNWFKDPHAYWYEEIFG